MASQISKPLAFLWGISFSVAASAATLIQEGFDSVSSLAAAGWSLVNQSTPGGSVPTYFQGNTVVFDSQAGATDSYIASNYQVAPTAGIVSNWLVTPTFSTSQAGTVSFWLRGEAFTPYQDVLRYGFIDVVPTSTVTGSFSSGVQTVNVLANATGWEQITVSFAAGGAGSVGRFGWEHANGNSDDADYFGIDTVLISTVSAVPEPSEVVLLSLGLLSLSLMRRRAK